MTANIIDYVEEEFADFSEKPFNDVDSLVLSQLSYIHFDAVLKHYPPETEIEIRDLLRAEDMDLMLMHVRDPQKNKKLLYALAASPRYRNIRLGHFESRMSDWLEEQFAAVTFYTPDEQAYIVFRGTDSTLVGWKEDFNMAFMPFVPAQYDALAYFEHIAEDYPGWLHLSGHSKGGNLAIYAAACADPDIQARIKTVYAHDAPGFSRERLETDGYQRIQSRIRKTIPHASMIGMLLENHDAYTIVESRQLGLMQHDPFSWTVEDGQFCTLETLSSGAAFMNNMLDEWITGMSMIERERFVDALYSVLSAGKITNIYDLSSTLQPSNLIAMHNAAAELDPETREFVFQIIKRLGSAAVQNLPKLPKPADRLSKSEEDGLTPVERLSEAFTGLLPKATELLSKPVGLISRTVEERAKRREVQNASDKDLPELSESSELPEESDKT